MTMKNGTNIILLAEGQIAPAYICQSHVVDVKVCTIECGSMFVSKDNEYSKNIAPAAASFDANNNNTKHNEEGVPIQIEPNNIDPMTNGDEGCVASQCRRKDCENMSSHRCSDCGEYFCDFHSVEITPVKFGMTPVKFNEESPSTKFHRCDHCEQRPSRGTDIFCILVCIIVLLMCVITAIYGEYLSNS